MKASTILFKRKLSLVMQSERSECGLACLTMLANFFGHNLSLNEIRARFNVSRRGANIPQLMRFGEKLQLETRPIKCELEALNKLRLPAILHWNMKHYVVLNSIKGQCYEIFDPAIGRRIKTLGEMSDSFTGVALEVWPQTGFKPEASGERLSLKQYLGNFSGFAEQIMRSMVLSIAILLTTLVIPAIMQVFYDEGLASADQSLITSVIVGISVVSIFQILAQFVRNNLQLSLGTQLSLFSSSALYTHLMRLPMRYFERRSSHDIASRFGSNETLKTFLLSGITGALLDGIMAIFMVVFMLLYAPKLALIALISALCLGVLRAVTLPVVKALSLEGIHQKTRMQGNLLETIRSIQTIKVFKGECTRQAIWQNDFVQSLQNDVLTARFALNVQTVQQALSLVEKAVTLALGASLVFSKELTPGMFIAFLSYKDQFISRAVSLVDAAIQYRLQMIHLDRIADIALSQPERTVDDLPFPLDVDGSVSIENLSFRHDDESPILLRDINLRVSEGESIAIVAPSGQGKTTLLKIILGLAHPCEGMIRIGGLDSKHFGGNLQKMFGTVMQDDRLISGTIADNIAFFDDEMDFDRLAQSAKAAQIHEDILKLPMGYNSLIGEQGTALSSGQVQRILIARALYRQPRILLMDEATSHLDPVREQAINATLRSMKMTRIIVAHRLETILSAERIYRLVNKTLVEISKEEFESSSPATSALRMSASGFVKEGV